MAKLEGQIPVRFPEQLAGAARHLAQQDGMTLSAWIRRIVDRELAAREGRCPTCGHAVPHDPVAESTRNTTEGET